MRHVTRRPADWLRCDPIAHRGLHGDGAVENTLEAFEAAVSAGYPIELDVRLAQDGVVVFHDAGLDRLTDGSGPVVERSVAELSQLSLGGTSQRIPTLAQTLDVVAGRTPLLVELKTGDGPGPLERSVAELLDGYHSPFAVQSFNPMTVRWFARQRPDFDRGLLSASFDDVDMPLHRRFVLRRLGLAPLCRPHFVGYELGALPYWATDLARRAGLPLLAWTVRTPAELLHARRLADNVIFEHVRPGSGNARDVPRVESGA